MNQLTMKSICVSLHLTSETELKTQNNNINIKAFKRFYIYVALFLKNNLQTRCNLTSTLQMKQTSSETRWRRRAAVGVSVPSPTSLPLRIQSVVFGCFLTFLTVLSSVGRTTNTS